LTGSLARIQNLGAKTAIVKKAHFRPEDFALKQTKPEVYVATQRSLEVQGDHRVGFFAVAHAAANQPVTCHQKAGHNAECQQYPDENKGVYDEVPDVIFAGGNILVAGDLGLIANLR